MTYDDFWDTEFYDVWVQHHIFCDTLDEVIYEWDKPELRGVLK